MTRPVRPALPELPSLLLATVAGIVALAIADAPQSLGLVFRVGIDLPQYAGEQLVIAAAGAFGTAVAVLLAQHWRRLLTVGVLGVLVSHLFHNPDWAGISARVVQPNEPREQFDLTATLPWLAIGLAASGVLLIGVLGAVQRLWRLHRAGAALAAVAGCAAYLGPMVVGPLRGPDLGVVRLVLLVLALVLTAATLLHRDDDEQPVNRVAAAAVLFTVAPTVLVLVTGELAFGTWQHGVVGLVLLAVGATAATTLGQNALLATSAAAITLAAPAVSLVFLADALVLGWGEGASLVVVPLAVLAAAGLSFLRFRTAAASVVVLLSAVVTVLMALGVAEYQPWILWVYLAACTASVALAVGSTAPLFAARGSLPAAAAVITTLALGVHCTLSFLRMTEEGPPLLGSVSGAMSMLTVGALLLVAAILLALLMRLDRVRTDGPGDDYRRVLTTTSTPDDD